MSEWSWLNNFSCAVKTAQALSTRQPFPKSFFSEDITDKDTTLGADSIPPEVDLYMHIGYMYIVVDSPSAINKTVIFSCLVYLRPDQLVFCLLGEKFDFGFQDIKVYQ